MALTVQEIKTEINGKIAGAKFILKNVDPEEYNRFKTYREAAEILETMPKMLAFIEELEAQKNTF